MLAAKYEYINRQIPTATTNCDSSGPTATYIISSARKTNITRNVFLVSPKRKYSNRYTLYTTTNKTPKKKYSNCYTQTNHRYILKGGRTVFIRLLFITALVFFYSVAAQYDYSDHNQRQRSAYH